MNNRRRRIAKSRAQQRKRLRRNAQWVADCMRWRGSVLLGRFSHWCFEWDGLPVDETSREWPCCGVAA